MVRILITGSPNTRLLGEVLPDRPQAPLRSMACRAFAPTLAPDQGERDTVLERPERRRQAREADDRVEHDVGLRALEKLGQVAPDLRQRGEPVDRLEAEKDDFYARIDATYADLAAAEPDRIRELDAGQTPERVLAAARAALADLL